MQIYKKGKQNDIHILIRPLTEYLQLWQRLQPRVFAHQHFGFVFLPFSSLQILSSTVRLEGTSGGQSFLSLSRDLQSGSIQGSGWATEGRSHSCPLSHSCIVLVMSFSPLHVIVHRNVSLYKSLYAKSTAIGQNQISICHFLVSLYLSTSSRLHLSSIN